MSTWLITGITSGIGRHLAEQLLERGHRVVGTVRESGSVDDLAAKYQDTLWTAQLDVSDTAAVQQVVPGAFGKLGRIDVVVNNAGYGVFGSAEELTDEQITGIIGTNLVGSIQVARAALPYLRGQGGGRIIQISSFCGQATNAGVCMYHATKWGIEGFMESLAKDVAPFGIEVTIVEPGGARTEFRFDNMQLGTPMREYDHSPAASIRDIKNRSRPSLGDPAKMAARIIESTDRRPAPRRLVLGSDAHRLIMAALTERLAEVEAQATTAGSTDWIG